MDATKRIEAALARLVMPMWIAAAAIIAFLIFRQL